MHAPATGKVISEMILDGEAREMDVSVLSPTRVRENRLLHEINVI